MINYLMQANALDHVDLEDYLAKPDKIHLLATLMPIIDYCPASLLKKSLSFERLMSQLQIIIQLPAMVGPEVLEHFLAIYEKQPLVMSDIYDFNVKLSEAEVKVLLKQVFRYLHTVDLMNEHQLLHYCAL